MSRRRRVYKKEERVDSRYGSQAVARLISTVMKRGKKSLAERIVYTAIDKSRAGSDSVDPLEVQYADKRKGMPMADALAQEIKDAAAGQGNAIKKREDTHKMAQANRAFAHFRW